MFLHLFSIFNAVFKVEKMHSGSKQVLGLGIFFPYNYLKVLKVSRKSEAAAS